MMTEHRILLVEDERAVAKGLEYGLRNEGFEVMWVDTGRKALSQAATYQPHLIVLDVRLPDLNGFDVCRQLRASGHRQPILMLTARHEAMDKVLGLELGADDYVTKPYDLRELISRVRALLRRAYGELATPNAPSRLVFDELEIDLERLLVKRQGQILDLTPLEFRLLHYMVSHVDHPLSRDRLIEAVWGYDSDINNDRTIDVHIRHLRQKLEIDPTNPRWLLTVRGVGYKFSA